MKIKLKNKTQYLNCKIINENTNNVILQVTGIDNIIKNIVFDKIDIKNVCANETYYLNLNDDIFHKVDVKNITFQNENNLVMDGIIFGEIKLNSRNVTKFDLNREIDKFKILKEKK